MIYINKLEIVKGEPKLVEQAQFENGTISGKINIKDITRKEVLDQFNRGYYRTSEI